VRASAIQVDSTGEEQWARDYGPEPYERFQDIVAASNGASIGIVGPPDHSILRINEQGDSLWTYVYGGTTTGLSSSAAIDSTNYIFVGSTNDFGVPYASAVLVRLVESGTSVRLPKHPIPSRFELLAYPNPFNSTTTLHITLPIVAVADLQIYDTVGRIVLAESLSPTSPGSHDVRVNARDWATGTYFARIMQGEMTQTIRIILLR
jgi:hypothetical protein